MGAAVSNSGASKVDIALRAGRLPQPTVWTVATHQARAAAGLTLKARGITSNARLAEACPDLAGEGNAIDKLGNAIPNSLGNKPVAHSVLDNVRADANCRSWQRAP